MKPTHFYFIVSAAVLFFSFGGDAQTLFSKDQQISLIRRGLPKGWVMSNPGSNLVITCVQNSPGDFSFEMGKVWNADEYRRAKAKDDSILNVMQELQQHSRLRAGGVIYILGSKGMPIGRKPIDTGDSAVNSKVAILARQLIDLPDECTQYYSLWNKPTGNNPLQLNKGAGYKDRNKIVALISACNCAKKFMPH